MDLQEARELARKKMKGCYVCPECDGKACKGMISRLWRPADGKIFPCAT